MVAAKNPSNESRLIPRADIFVPPTWNVRHVTSPVDELAANIKANGLLSPVTVVPTSVVLLWDEMMKETPDAQTGATNDSPPYTLIIGFRRTAACDQAGIDEIRAEVQPDPTLAIAALMNIGENVHRDPLHECDLCDGMVRIQAIKRAEYKMQNPGSDDDSIPVLKGYEIAKLIGIDKRWGKTQAERMLRVGVNLHPTIKDAWRKKHGALTQHLIFDLASKPHAVQLEEWEKLRTNKDTNPKASKRTTDPKTGKRKNSKKGDTDKVKRPSLKVIEEAYSRTNADCFPKWSEDMIKGAKLALKFALGERTYPKGQELGE